MNLRLLLVLISILSYVAIGVTWVITNPTEEEKEPDPPFFYTLSPGDLRNIRISNQDAATSFSLREDSRRWFFDDMNDVPADMFRWGGIAQLLGGPQTQRVLKQDIGDISLYGLDTPTTELSVTLRDETVVTLLLGDLTPDGVNQYSQVKGYPQLVLVDATWGAVFERLVDEPPLPEWFYTIGGDVREIILFDNYEVLRAYGWDRENENWTVCEIPLVQDPCVGTQLADGVALEAEIEHFGNPIIDGAVALNVSTEDEFALFGAGILAPYVAMRIENKTSNNVTEVTRLTMSIGDETQDGNSRFAVANETSDVIAVDKEWAERVLDLFFGDLLVDNG
jgi:hypothetical protein